MTLDKKGVAVKSVSVDIGGTFTDVFLSYDDHSATGKAPTTRHRISMGVLDAIGNAAEELDVPLGHVISESELIRYATTISLNTLLQRTGPRLGLIATKGFEDTIFIGRARQWLDGKPIEEVLNQARIDKPEPIIPRQMVEGVGERIDAAGNVVRAIDRSEVEAVVSRLVDKGAQGFVIALINSHMNPENERAIADLIDDHYPEAYLGAVPVLLSSDVTPTIGEYPRSDTVILNGYLHRELSEELGSLGDELRDAGYAQTLLAVHAGGGSAPIEQTTPISTFGSGPVAGLFGASKVCKAYGADLAALTDMGGTSFDLGVLRGGEPRYYEMRPMVEHWLVRTPSLEVKSLGAGGGSIVRVEDYRGRITVGPESAGALPGPACYDLGGTEPTVTDADVVLGFIGPEQFLGGRMNIDPDLAMTALEAVGRKAGLDPVKMAWAVRRIADARMSAEMHKELNLKGIDPRKVTVLSYGGAGPTHCCGYAGPLDPERILVLPESPVFCAFGASQMDVSQVYVRSLSQLLVDGTGNVLDGSLQRLRETIDALVGQARQQFEEQGFPTDELELTVAIEMKYGGQINPVLTESPIAQPRTADDVRTIAQSFEEHYAALYSAMSAFPAGGIECETVQLKCALRVPSPDLIGAELGEADPSDARMGSRSVYWDGETATETPTYSFRLLRPGMVVTGPAIVDAANTTVVVEADWRLEVDQYRSGALSKQGGAP